MTNPNLKDEAGFALPSVLMLLALLTLIAFSVITAQFLRRQVVLIDQARMKAEYAAQSGIELGLASLDSLADASGVSLEHSFEYTIGDGSQASVKIDPWGLLFRISSQGTYRKARALRIATVGVRLSRRFDPAILLSNQDRQLVLAGNSTVRGDVVVGPLGVSTGALKDYKQPGRIPVLGKVRREASPVLPEIDLSLASRFTGHLRDIMSRVIGNGAEGRVFTTGSDGEESSYGTIPDTAMYLSLNRTTTSELKFQRRSLPIFIVRDGDVRIESSSRLQGFVAILATKRIFVERGASIEGAVFFAGESVTLEAGASVSAQILAPTVILKTGTLVRYPSLVCSSPHHEDAHKIRTITLEENSRVEGNLLLLGGESNPDNLIEIKVGASLMGVAYSTARLTVDGRVEGGVFTKDFFFYQAPTSYLGWLRGASIDRNALEKGFLTTPIFRDQSRAEVLEWF